jgi:hypothetical protein
MMMKSERRKEPTQEKPDPLYGTVDERTRAVADAGNSWALVFLMFALMLDAGYRALIRKEAPWDLIALFIIAGWISILYQYKHRVFARGLKWHLWVGLIGAAFGIVFAVLLIIIRWFAR